MLSSGSRRSAGDNTLKPRNGLLPRYSEEQEKDDFVIGDDEEGLSDGVTESISSTYEIGEKEEPPMYGDGENDENARVHETISADRETGELLYWIECLDTIANYILHSRQLRGSMLHSLHEAG